MKRLVRKADDVPIGILLHGAEEIVEDKDPITKKQYFNTLNREWKLEQDHNNMEWQLQEDMGKNDTGDFR